MLIWWNMTQHDKTQPDVMSAPLFSLELHILTLPEIAQWLLSRTGDGEETNRCVNLSTVSTSISRCPALIRRRLFPAPAKISLLLFSNHLVCASNHLLLRHLWCWLLMRIMKWNIFVCEGNVSLLFFSETAAEVRIHVRNTSTSYRRQVMKGLLEFTWRNKNTWS